MGTILGAWPLVYIGAAMPAGAVLDRFGLRRSLFAAALLIALSGLLRAGAFDALSLFVAVAVFGLGGPLISSGAPKLIAQWFDEKERGTAMGIYLTGPSLGGIASLSLTNSVLMPLTGYSWRYTLLIYVAFTLLAGLIWLILSAHPAARIDTDSAGAGDGNGASKKFDWGVYPQLMRVPLVRIVLLMSVGVFLFNHGLNNWLPEILRRGGMSAVQAGYWAAIPTAVGILGSLTIPRLALPARRIPILFGLCACAALAALLIATGSGVLLAVALTLQGIARSSMMTLTMLIMMESKEISHQNMGAAAGLFFSAAEIGGVMGPLTLGVVADLSGGFTTALLMLSVLCLGLMALTLSLRSRRGA
jgi:cyanate permease